ncbi:MAG: signal peptidase I [Micrococcus sp.]|nr:signal peptidase I [Micrococcus sp.]
MSGAVPASTPPASDESATPATDTEGSSPAKPGRRQRKPLPFGVALILNIVIALVVVAVVQTFLVKVYSVPSGSMEQTLNVGDRMLVNRLAYGGDGSPEVQDVVVFNGDEQWMPPLPDAGPVDAALRTFGDLTGIGRSNDQALVKRVLGTGGQEVECCSAEGAVTVDGEALQEDYLYEDFPFVPGTLDCTTTPMSQRCFGPLRIPEDHILAVGDHRSNSGDSVTMCRGQSAEEAGNCARYVSVEDVVGEVFVTVWPPSNWSVPTGP